MQRSALSAPAIRWATRGTADQVPAASGGPASTDLPADADTVVVHVQLRPRRGATRKCLAALAALAAEHPEVSFAITGLAKDGRVVRVTVGVDLGPRAGVAKFSPQAQAAYAFVSALFTSLYDHMPVYTAEPSAAERAAATTLLEAAAGMPSDRIPASVPALGEAEQIPAPRAGSWGERLSA